MAELSRGPQSDRLIIRRRNSSIEIASGATGTVVRKRYHARFSALQEFLAYGDLRALFQNRSGIRLPSSLSIDEDGTCLSVEYIAGPNLSEAFLDRGVQAFDERRDALVSLFSDARMAQQLFDSDPGNFILARDTDELVLVDPVSANSDLPDFVMVVFLWGMIKSFARGFGPHKIRSFWRCWKSFCMSYRKVTGCRPRDLSRQMSSYIRLVISWNLHESQLEPWWKRSVRVTLLVPAYWIAWLAFRYHWVGR